MRNNLSSEDLHSASLLLQENDPKLTSGPRVFEFEESWSKWLGCKYSVFVNSGSSANLLAIAYLRLKHPHRCKVIVPPLTWSSDISSIIWLGLTPVFVDISLSNLALNDYLVIEALKSDPDIKAVFLTHAQGLNGLSNNLYNYCIDNDIFLIEDVCESHGVISVDSQKAGCLGQISCFSFYYAHHMSTIEGGMLCTDDFDIYQTLLMLRGHGLLREMSSESRRSELISSYPDLNPSFIFPIPGFNVRNNEIGALIGLSQLPKLDTFIQQRRRNFELFLSGLPEWAFTEFDIEGQSNYAFNLILKDKDPDLFIRICNTLLDESIEFRRGSAGGGNQLRQPYVQDHTSYSLDDATNLVPVADHVHFFGLYIGNFPDLSLSEIDYILHVLHKV